MSARAIFTGRLVAWGLFGTSIWVLVLGGSIALLYNHLAAAQVRADAEFLSAAQRTTADVVRVTEFSADGSPLYVDVRYTLSTGTFTGNLDLSLAARNYGVGDHIAVLVNTKSPHKPRLPEAVHGGDSSSLANGRTMGLIVTAMGLIGVLATAMWLISDSRKRRTDVSMSVPMRSTPVDGIAAEQRDES
jgi:hypothetical protein